MISRDKGTAAVEYGDYQTPIPFARSVCTKLKEVYRLSPTVIIEPTFGTGNFIESAISEFEAVKDVYGIELNETYYLSARQRLHSQNTARHINLFNADIFSFDFSGIKENLSEKDNILIIGNPPWATNSQLSSLYSDNLPVKENFKGYSGLDAITGKGNFDIAEYIILQMLREFSGYACTLAMLCKTIVAKNIVRDMRKYRFSISAADLFSFHANDVFHIGCDAALFVVKLGGNNTSICNVYDYKTNHKIRRFGWQGGAFYSDIPADSAASGIDGKCPLEWRQGVKHDCSKVMELKFNGNSEFTNGLGDTVRLEIGKYVFPLVKSSDIKSNEIRQTRKYVLITQRQVNADTSIIEKKDKFVWDYLLRYENLLNARRSVIYKKSPKYSIFGIGDYSFSKYKVGVSGFYKEPTFALIAGEHPIMLDDTCYFLSFDHIDDAVITTALLNSPVCQTFLKSIAFLDSKRPYTKEVLKRIDLLKLCGLLSYDYVSDFARAMKGRYSITEEQYRLYASNLGGKNLTPLQ